MFFFNRHINPYIIWPHFAFPIFCVPYDHATVILVDTSLMFSPLFIFEAILAYWDALFSLFIYPNFLFFPLWMSLTLNVCLILCHKDNTVNQHCFKSNIYTKFLCVLFCWKHFFFCYQSLNINCIFLMAVIYTLLNIICILV